MNRLFVSIGLCASLILSPLTVYAEEIPEESVISKEVEWFSRTSIVRDTEKENEPTLGRYDSLAVSSRNLEKTWVEDDCEEEKQGVDNAYGETYDEIYGTENRDIYSGCSASGYDFTDREIWVLAQVMHHEAGNQREAGQIAVVEVILNRLFSKYFPDTVCGVVYAPKQFSYVERSKRIVPTDRELELVQDVVLGNKKILDDPTITYYRNPDICIGIPARYKHDWGRLKYVCYVQDHAFYRDESRFASDWSRPINREFGNDDYEEWIESEDEEYEDEYEEEYFVDEENVSEEDYVEDSEYVSEEEGYIEEIPEEPVEEECCE